MPSDDNSMKVGIVGVGAVGTACAKAMLLRGSCQEVLLLDSDEERALGVCTDLSHGEPLCPTTRIRHGSYEALSDSAVVVITAGFNEKSGGAVDRDDDRGRLLLLPRNAEVYEEVVPRIAEVAPRAILLVVTDPPDPLADVARCLTESNPVLSSGTFLDTLRFKIQIATRLGCRASSVEAMVIGEHGTSQVYVWSLARIGGEPVLDRAARMGLEPRSFQAEVVKAVKYANIDIIEGTGASQHGIGIVAARLVEAVLRDEKLVAPIGSFRAEYGVTLSLPSVIGRAGVESVLEPRLSEEESEGLSKSAAAISEALEGLGPLGERQVVISPHRVEDVAIDPSKPAKHP